MGTLEEDLRAVKAVEDKIITNKVANFAYTDKAYTDNDADSVAEYNVDNEQNIPDTNATTLKVNDTVLSKGFRAKASSLTRMLVNHFFGRVSYNLNKVNDSVSNLVNTLINHRGTANGLATLDEDAKVPYSELYIASETKKGIVKQGAVMKFFRTLYFPTLGSTCIAYGKGLFVVGGTGGTIQISPDSMRWKHFQSTSYQSVIYAITYANGVFVAVGADGFIRTSTDGITWTGKSISSVTLYSLNSITYGKGLFVAVGDLGNILTSPDGITWTERTSPVNDSTLRSITYDNTTESFVVVGSNGAILTSPDGITWTKQAWGDYTVFYSVTSDDRGIFIAVGEDGKIIESTNAGKNWIQRGSTVTTFLRGVAYGGGLFVAVGDNGVILTSPDGTTWAKWDSTSTDSFQKVVFGEKYFIILKGNNPTYSKIAFTNAVAIDAEGNMTVPVINGILERLKALEAK